MQTNKKEKKIGQATTAALVVVQNLEALNSTAPRTHAGSLRQEVLAGKERKKFSSKKEEKGRQPETRVPAAGENAPARNAAPRRAAAALHLGRRHGDLVFHPAATCHPCGRAELLPGHAGEPGRVRATRGCPSRTGHGEAARHQRRRHRTAKAAAAPRGARRQSRRAGPA